MQPHAHRCRLRHHIWLAAVGCFLLSSLSFSSLLSLFLCVFLLLSACLLLHLPPALLCIIAAHKWVSVCVFTRESIVAIKMSERVSALEGDWPLSESLLDLWPVPPTRRMSQLSPALIAAVSLLTWQCHCVETVWSLTNNAKLFDSQKLLYSIEQNGEMLDRK